MAEPPTNVHGHAATYRSQPQQNLFAEGDSDNGYSLEVAQRSVARAALALGIDSMSTDALDAMGHVLITYIERIGQSMASIVETGGRSSAHCNILDAIDAVELNLGPSNEQGDKWESLSRFAFGKSWMEKTVDFSTGDVIVANDPAKVTATAVSTPGSSHKPNPAQDSGATQGTSKTSNRIDEGWNAPYLDEVPPYPLSSDVSYTLAVGNNLLATDAEVCWGENDGVPKKNDSLCVDRHKDFAEDAAFTFLKQIPPDRYFGSYYTTETQPATVPPNVEGGGVDTSKKRSRPDNTNDDTNDTNEPNAKKVKTVAFKEHKDAENKHASLSGFYSSASEDDDRPAYVPSYFPPFPPKHTYQPFATAVRDDLSVTSPAIPTPLSIRSSLVQQQRQQNSREEEKRIGPAMAVPSGLTSNAQSMLSSSHLVEDRKKKESVLKNTGVTIVPLEKISVARVSKILEGSMDMSQCG